MINSNLIHGDDLCCMRTSQEDFKKILVLVDFSAASLHAVEEAAILAAKFNSELHLLHVSLSPALSYLLMPEVFMLHMAEDEPELVYQNYKQLNELKWNIANRYSIKIISHVAKDHFKKAVSDLVQHEGIDLTVIGAKRKTGLKHLLFGSVPELVIKTAGCEVLCVYPESDCSQMKKIVIPVENYIPKKKIRLAYKLARKFAANIHLITLNKNVSGVASNNAKMLMAAYQYVKDITNLPVECKTLEGNNLAKAAVSYAQKIKADLIMVNPGIESQVSGPVLRKRNSDIVNYSSIPVLSVKVMMDY